MNLILEDGSNIAARILKIQSLHNYIWGLLHDSQNSVTWYRYSGGKTAELMISHMPKMRRDSFPPLDAN